MLVFECKLAVPVDFVACLNLGDTGRKSMHGPEISLFI